MHTSLWALFASAFLWATLAPGNSELVLLVVLREGAAFWPAVLIATIGNTLGGVTTFAVGHVFLSAKVDAKTIERVRRWGTRRCSSERHPIEMGTRGSRPLPFAALR